MIWDILEEETGARLTHCFGRIGGMAKPPTAELQGACAATRIPRDPRRSSKRARGCSSRTASSSTASRASATSRGADAIALGVDGPVPARDAASPTTCARRTRTSSTTRSTSTSRSARTATTSIASSCRLEEIRQSARIIEQALRPDGRRRARSTSTIRASSCPPKEDVYTTIEGTIQHFKLVMEGAKVPAGEVYSYTEGGNGELGFYLVSDGSGTPYRVRIRPPCFADHAGPLAAHQRRACSATSSRRSARST